MTDMPLADLPAGADESSWLAACAVVRRYCGWHIAPSVTETLTLDGPGGTLLRLPSAYVTAVTSVANDGTAIDDPEWSAHGMVRAHCWTEKFRGVVVELTHGYRECPDDLLDVLVHMAAQGQAAASAGAGIATSLTSGPFTMQVSAAAQAGAVGLSGQHRGVLNKYRLGPVP